MTEQISIIRLRKELLGDLAGLFLNIFGVKHTTEYLQRKYDTPDLGASYLGFLAYDLQQRPIAFCGGIPCRMAFRGKEISGLQFCDTMTLEQWRGKGLFGQLATRLEQLALEQGIKFHFAFLNQDSFWSYQKKLDWQIVGEMRRHVFPIYTVPIQKMGSYFTFLHRLQKQQTARCLSKLDKAEQLPNPLLEEGKLVVIHDAGFFKYKLQEDHYLLALDGAHVWVKLRGGMWVGDIIIEEITNLQDFIHQLKRLGFQLGIHKLHLQFTKNTFLEKRLATITSNQPSWKIGAKSFDPQFPASELALTLGDVDTF